MTRLREDNRKIRSDYDELQLRFDDEVYNSGSWKKEKERLDTKILDLNAAYEAAIAAQGDQQSQIVALHSQVRELRAVLSDAETERTLLQKARRALQAELEGAKLDTVDANKISSDREFQKLQLKKQDLERSLEEQDDRVGMAFDRMKKAEAHANECQVELDKIRLDNSELDKQNASAFLYVTSSANLPTTLQAHLEKQIKDLNVRIVDFETKSYRASPQPNSSTRRLEARIEELTNQLNQLAKDKGESSRIQRSTDKVARDAKFQLAESDRQRARLEEERNLYESQVQSLRQSLDVMVRMFVQSQLVDMLAYSRLQQTEESTLQLAKRRAEREAADLKQKALK